MTQKTKTLVFNGLDFSEMLERIYTVKWSRPKAAQFEALLHESLKTGDVSDLQVWMHNEADDQLEYFAGGGAA